MAKKRPSGHSKPPNKKNKKNKKEISKRKLKKKEIIVGISQSAKSHKKNNNNQLQNSTKSPRKENKSNINRKNVHSEQSEIPFITKDDNSIVIHKPVRSKREKIRLMLQEATRHNTIPSNAPSLRDRMLERLKAAQFRYLNEKLYTSSGSEAQELFKKDPGAFETYHVGYQQQLKKWPINPLDVIVQKLAKMPKSHTVADMGCGEGVLSTKVSQTLRSFDLVSRAPHVEACDMAHTPLLRGSVDVAVYCLALMGTQLTQYLVEANRVLKDGGALLIAEVESRFENVDEFVKDVQKLGFKLVKLDKTHEVFVFLDFKKVNDPPAKRSKLPNLHLNPCLYKRR